MDRYVVRLHTESGELLSHVTVDTSLPLAEMQERIKNFALDMHDATHAAAPAEAED